MNEAGIITSIRDSNRPARFEARTGDFSGVFNVTYLFADENGTRYVFLRDYNRDDAERIASDMNDALQRNGLLALPTY